MWATALAVAHRRWQRRGMTAATRWWATLRFCPPYGAARLRQQQRHRDEERHDDTSAPTISAAGGGRGRAARHLAHGRRAGLPVAPGAADRAGAARRRARHHRAPDGAMAVGKARPDLHHREPARRRHQYRRRSGRARAAGRLHAAPGPGIGDRQRDALSETQFRFHPRHHSDRDAQRTAAGDGGEPVIPGQDGA